MSLSPQEAISQAEELILEFCAELPDEELMKIEEVNFEKIKSLMNEVGHAAFADALANDIEPPSLFDLQFYARFGNHEVAPLLRQGLKSEDKDDVEDAVVGLCYLESEEGLKELKLAIQEKKFKETNEEYFDMLFEEVLDEVSEEYKDKIFDIMDEGLES